MFRFKKGTENVKKKKVMLFIYLSKIEFGILCTQGIYLEKVQNNKYINGQP